MTEKWFAATWDLCGISGPFGLDRPLRSALISVPTVELVGDRLYWRFEPSKDPDGHHFRTVVPGPQLLQHFVELAEAPDQKILLYARRWGVLEICEHGLPACHHDLDNAYCVPQGAGDSHFWESISAWRTYATLFRSLLNIAARLSSGRPGHPFDWDLVIAIQRFGDHFHKGGVAFDHLKLEIAMNVLLAQSGVRPLVRLTKGNWQVQFAGGHMIGCGLFGAIVCQLMLAVTRTEGIEICSACGNAYFPARRPNRDRRNYCENCRDGGIPLRDAARDYRKKQKAGHKRAQ